jgi:hypothetical protein
MQLFFNGPFYLNTSYQLLLICKERSDPKNAIGAAVYQYNKRKKQTTPEVWNGGGNKA